MEKFLTPGVNKILGRLIENNYKAFIVGGAVRDMVAGEKPKDFDIVTDASLENIRQAFKNDLVKIVGKSFNVCLVNGIEVASFRGNTLDQGNTLDRGDKFSRGDKFRFPLADLEKRDFTMNSMAWDPETGQVLDPFSGQQDLKEKIIRFTGDGDQRILEDPLRMIRACRFASRLNGRLACETFEAIKKHGDLVTTGVAKERIRMEILKAMVHDQPSIFFKTLQATGLLKNIFPCVDRLVDLDGGPFHGETVFEHSMMVGDALSPKRPLLRLAGFLHDAGKFDAAMVKEGVLTFHGHEKEQDKIEEDLVNLKFSLRERSYILSLIAVHMRPLTDKTTPKAVRRILALLEAHGLDYREFLRMRIADKRSNLAKPCYNLGDIRNRVQKFKNELDSKGGGAFTVADLAIDGNDVMAILDLSPGPEVGRIMAFLFEKVLDDPGLNNRPMLERLVCSLGDKF